MRLALYEPDQAGNVGTILRLAACLGVAVDIIEPCGFPFSDRALKRAGMDYAELASVTRHSGWQVFAAQAEGRLVLLTSSGSERIDRIACAPGAILLVGSERFSKWAEEYFYLPHRGVRRGVGGIFYDHLECAEPGHGASFEANFAFTRDVGLAFLDIFPRLVRRRMATHYTPEDKAKQLEWRGRYAEFNLIYDRGTLFGLRTGGNVDAILMSLPPEATWR